MYVVIRRNRQVGITGVFGPFPAFEEAEEFAYSEKVKAEPEPDTYTVFCCDPVPEPVPLPC